jgi:dynein heavy chain
VQDGFKKFQDGDKDGTYNAWQIMVALLIALIKLTQTDLNKPTRQKVMCMITLDAHNRDIQDKMYREGVSEVDAFQWQSQLKSAWDEEIDDAKQFIADAIFVYGYEYLGNGPRLVVTPLTDRIYVTATQALHLCMGCAPAGPAGTGKTESTKDLANALAKACYVINAAPEMDYLTMGNTFKGLAASGSWGCFDEYNRLIPEVLSVNTVQFKAVCDAIRMKQKRFVLQGDEINLDPTCGAYITMNPGYLGRSELPEGLKALFRPITVMVPDFCLIMENMFMSEGFLESKALGQKFAVLYALNKDLLSKAPQYDWGMRAIKSVLVVAGSMKRADPDLPEQAVLMRSLRDTNVAKIDGDDLIIFMGLLGDLFPGIDVPRSRDLEWEEMMVQIMQDDMGYTHDSAGYAILKTTQLIELLMIRHSVFMMGPPGSFKSMCWRLLAKSKDKLGDKMTLLDYNPKAFTTNEVYGYVNGNT